MKNENKYGMWSNLRRIQEAIKVLPLVTQSRSLWIQTGFINMKFNPKCNHKMLTLDHARTVAKEHHSYCGNERLLLSLLVSMLVLLHFAVSHKKVHIMINTITSSL